MLRANRVRQLPQELRICFNLSRKDPSEQTCVRTAVDQQNEAVVGRRIDASREARARQPADYPAVSAALSRVFTRVEVGADSYCLSFAWLHAPEHPSTLILAFRLTGIARAVIVPRPSKMRRKSGSDA